MPPTVRRIEAKKNMGDAQRRISSWFTSSAGDCSSRSRSKKGPNQGRKRHRDDPNQNVERHANLDVIAEAITTGTVDHEVGLIADGRGKAGTGRHHHHDYEWQIVGLQTIGRID